MQNVELQQEGRRTRHKKGEITKPTLINYNDSALS
jgi:hypothetical protein